jgi:hypothetical protein
LLIYKVFPDGREQLVRNLRFRNISVRALRDIVGVSDEQYVFDFINNAAPFALVGGANYVTGSAVVAPAVLMEELEFERQDEQQPKPPVVPPPALGAQ